MGSAGRNNRQKFEHITLKLIGNVALILMVDDPAT